jgi:deoxyribonuclease V
MTWPTTAGDLIARQRDLADAGPAPWRPQGASLLMAGCFVCFAPGEKAERAWAGAALTRGHHHLKSTAIAGRITAPYEPGLLALREGPLLEAAVGALEESPEVVIVNATGRDHPRGAGLALHLGAVLDLPTIGVTDRPLTAGGETPGGAKGDRSPLYLDDEVVGFLLRTRSGTRPVAVHAGWRTDPDTAVQLAMLAVRRARTPEPIRRARRIARLARAGFVPVTDGLDGGQQTSSVSP